MMNRSRSGCSPLNRPPVSFHDTRALLAFAVIRMVLPQLPEETLQSFGPFAGITKNTWWDGLFSTAPALVEGVAVSYLTPPPCEEELRGLLLRDRPAVAEPASETGQPS